MATRLVNVDRDTPMLLPVDLRQWVPENDLVHFVIATVDSMHLPSLSVNTRGSGSEQYPPQRMLALLIYCYANRIFSSRRIERATYRDLGARYLSCNTHPDHGILCEFHRQNKAVVKEAFVEVLRLAKEMGLVKVGTVSVDGTPIQANASKHKSVRYDRAGQLERQLREDIEELLKEAERCDRLEEEDSQSLPEQIARRERLREKLRSDEGRRIYVKRASTVEPVFGIIKASMGFRQFLLRGMAKLRIEWDLVCMAYNMRRLCSLAGA